MTVGELTDILDSLDDRSAPVTLADLAAGGAELTLVQVTADHVVGEVRTKVELS